MFIGCCKNCKYLDLVNENTENECPRCSGIMMSLGVTSEEWNRLNENDKQSHINSIFSSKFNAEYDTDPRRKSTESNSIMDIPEPLQDTSSHNSFISVKKCKNCKNIYPLRQISCDKCGSKAHDSLHRGITEDEYKIHRGIKSIGSAELADLYKQARKAKNESDFESAHKYYSLISEQKPSDWEAVFYAGYFSIIRKKGKRACEEAKLFPGYIDEVFEIIYYFNDKKAAKAAYDEMLQQIELLTESYYNTTLNYYLDKLRDNKTVIGDETDVLLNYEPISLLIKTYAETLYHSCSSTMFKSLYKDRIINDLKNQENHLVDFWTHIPQERKLKESYDLFVQACEVFSQTIIRFDIYHKNPMRMVKFVCNTDATHAEPSTEIENMPSKVKDPKNIKIAIFVATIILMIGSFIYLMKDFHSMSLIVSYAIGGIGVHWVLFAKEKGDPAFRVHGIIFIVIAVATGILFNAMANGVRRTEAIAPSSYSTKKNTSEAKCKSCGRTYKPGDTDGNFMNIARTGMCNNCYENFKWAKDVLENQ